MATVPGGGAALQKMPLDARVTNSKLGWIHGYLSRVQVGRGGEKKLSVTDRPTDRRTDRPTDGQSGL